MSKSSRELEELDNKVSDALSRLSWDRKGRTLILYRNELSSKLITFFVVGVVESPLSLNCCFVYWKVGVSPSLAV